MVRRFLVKILVSVLALWATDYLLSGFSVVGNWQSYALAGLVLGSLNTFLRPLLRLLTFPLIVVTLGLFTFVINGAILWFVAEALDSVVIANLWTLVLATLIVSAVNLLFDSPTDT